MSVPLEIARDHPAYAGHFPGHPILPGVVLLGEVLAALEAATGKPMQSWQVSNAKFLAPVTPGMALTLEQVAEPSGNVRFEVRSAGTLVASGVIAPSAE